MNDGVPLSSNLTVHSDNLKYLYMKRSSVLGSDIKMVEHQLAIKKAEYVHAIQKGEVFNELKKIFLEVKELQHRLQDSNNNAVSGDLRNAS